MLMKISAIVPRFSGTTRKRGSPILNSKFNLMNIIALCGSPRDGNTEFTLKRILTKASELGASTELVLLRKKRIEFQDRLKPNNIDYSNDQAGNYSIYLSEFWSSLIFSSQYSLFRSTNISREFSRYSRASSERSLRFSASEW